MLCCSSNHNDPHHHQLGNAFQVSSPQWRMCLDKLSNRTSPPKFMLLKVFSAPAPGWYNNHCNNHNDNPHRNFSTFNKLKAKLGTNITAEQSLSFKTRPKWATSHHHQITIISRELAEALCYHHACHYCGGGLRRPFKSVPSCQAWNFGKWSHMIY